ncbi:MAG: hypothetical protein ABI438_06805, partial [Dermatophilaceae bacterium]
MTQQNSEKDPGLETAEAVSALEEATLPTAEVATEAVVPKPSPAPRPQVPLEAVEVAVPEAPSATEPEAASPEPEPV